MKLFAKLTLNILAAMPVAAIAIPAESRLLDLYGEEQTSLLRASIYNAKGMLFPDLVMSTTIDEARIRVSEITGITDGYLLRHGSG